MRDEVHQKSFGPPLLITSCYQLLSTHFKATLNRIIARNPSKKILIFILNLYICELLFFAAFVLTNVDNIPLNISHLAMVIHQPTKMYLM